MLKRVTNPLPLGNHIPNTMLQNDYSGIPINSGITNPILLFQQHSTLLEDWGRRLGGYGECGVCEVGAGRGAHMQETVPILPALGLCETVRVSLVTSLCCVCTHTNQADLWNMLTGKQQLRKRRVQIPFQELFQPCCIFALSKINCKMKRWRISLPFCVLTS